jgi:ubiquinone/menaquinone biosynthesis C-methylase UbiE
MDYDTTDIPRGYDRGRDHGPDFRDLWMTSVSSHVKGRPVREILDLGCGTGRFAEALAAHFDAGVIGVDPSEKMLEQARQKCNDHRVRYAKAHGESLPLADGSVDLIFMSMVFHHFNDPAAVARECRRTLCGGGICFLRAGTRESIPAYAYIDFFPTTRPILGEYLPSGRSVCEAFEAAGFKTAAQEVVVQQIAPSYSVYADKLAAGADSVLVQLPPDEFDAGMTALRRRAKEGHDDPVTEPIDVFVFQ